MAKDDFDDFDFDSELDNLDNMFGQETPKPKNTREAIQQGLKDVGNSVIDNIKPSLQNYKGFMEDSMPDNTKELSRLIQDQYDNVFFKHSKQFDSLKKNSNQIKKEILKMVKADSKLGQAVTKIGEFFGLEDESSYRQETFEEQQQRMIDEFNASIGEQFSKQAAINLANEVKHEQQFKSTLSGLAAINTQMVTLNNFHNNLTSSYYKKSLELQYQHLFTTKALLKVQQEGMHTLVGQVESVIKNTSLPDAVKLLNKEVIAQIAKQNIINKATSSLMKTTPLEAFTNNLSRMIGRGLSSVAEKVSGFAMALDQGNQALEMSREFGGSPVAQVADMGMGFLKDKGARALKNRLDKTLYGKKANRISMDILSDPVSYFKNILDSKREKYQDNEFIDGILDKLDDGLSSLRYNPKTTNISYLNTNPNGVSIFDNRTKDSIVKVIPGLLSKIYGELKANRIGGSASKHELTYNFETQEFTNSAKDFLDTKKKLIKNFNNDNKYALDTIIRFYKKYTSLNKEESGLLAAGVFTYVTTRNRALNLSAIVSDRYLNTMDISIREKIKEAGTKILEDLDIDSYDLSNFLKAFVDLAHSIPDTDLMVEEAYASGNTKTLERLGFIGRNGENLLQHDDKKLEFFKRHFKYEAEDDDNIGNAFKSNMNNTSYKSVAGTGLVPYDPILAQKNIKSFKVAKKQPKSKLDYLPDSVKNKLLPYIVTDEETKDLTLEDVKKMPKSVKDVIIAGKVVSGLLSNKISKEKAGISDAIEELLPEGLQNIEKKKEREANNYNRKDNESTIVKKLTQGKVLGKKYYKKADKYLNNKYEEKVKPKYEEYKKEAIKKKEELEKELKKQYEAKKGKFNKFYEDKKKQGTEYYNKKKEEYTKLYQDKKKEGKEYLDKKLEEGKGYYKKKKNQFTNQIMPDLEKKFNKGKKYAKLKGKQIFSRAKESLNRKYEDAMRQYRVFKEKFPDSKEDLDEYSTKYLGYSVEQLEEMKESYRETILKKADIKARKAKVYYKRYKRQTTQFLDGAYKTFKKRFLKNKESVEELKQVFYESEEYKTGKVTNFNDWVATITPPEDNTPDPDDNEKSSKSSTKTHRTRFNLLVDLLKLSWKLDRTLTLGLLKGAVKTTKFGFKTIGKLGKMVPGLAKFGLKAGFVGASALPAQLYNLMADKYGWKTIDPGMGAIGRGSRWLDRKLTTKLPKKAGKVASFMIKVGKTPFKAAWWLKNFLFNSVKDDPNISEDTKTIVAGLDNVKASIDNSNPANKEENRKGSWLNRLKIFGKKNKAETKEDKEKSKGLIQWMKDHKGMSISLGLLTISGLLKSMGITLEDVKDVASGIWSGVKIVASGVRSVYTAVKDVVSGITGFFGFNKKEVKAKTDNKGNLIPVLDYATNSPKRNKDGKILYQTEDGGEATLDEIKNKTKPGIMDQAASVGMAYGAAKIAGHIPGFGLASKFITKPVEWGFKAAAYPINKLYELKTGKIPGKASTTASTAANAVKSTPIGTKILEWAKSVMSKISSWIPDKLLDPLKNGIDKLKDKFNKTLGSESKFLKKLKFLKTYLTNPKVAKKLSKTAAAKLLTKITVAVSSASTGIGTILTILMGAWEIGWILWYMYAEDMTFWQAFLKQLLGIDPDKKMLDDIEKEKLPEDTEKQLETYYTAKLNNAVNKVSNKNNSNNNSNNNTNNTIKPNNKPNIVKNNNVNINKSGIEPVKHNFTNQDDQKIINDLTKTSQGAKYQEANREEAQQYMHNLVQVKDNIVKPLRAKYGDQVTINSGFRGPTLNKKIGGAKFSRHMLGKAVDIGGIDTKQVAQDYIDGKIPGMPQGMNFIPEKRNSRWLHVDLDDFRMHNSLGKDTRHGSSVYEFSGLRTDNLIDKVDRNNIQPDLKINKKTESDIGPENDSEKGSNIHELENLVRGNNHRLDSINLNSAVQPTLNTNNINTTPIKPLDNPKFDNTTLSTISKTLIDSYQVQVRMADTLETIAKQTSVNNTNTKQETNKSQPQQQPTDNKNSISKKLRRNEYI